MLSESVAAPVAMSSSASVDVASGYALICTAMPSAAATSRASARSRWLLPAPRPSTGPAPSSHLAGQPLGVRRRRVAAEVAVDDDEHVGLHAPRLRLGAHERGLLVHGRHAGELRGARVGRVELQSAEHHVHAGAIVERLRRDHVRRKLDEVRRERDRVADGDAPQRLLPRRRADVEELLVQRRRLARSAIGMMCVGFLPPTACTGPDGAVDHEVAAGHEQRRHAADLVDEEVAVLVDVRDDEADLVGVRHDHDLRRPPGTDVEPHVAQGVGLHRPERRQPRAHDLLGRRLEPRGAGRQAQFLQQTLIDRHRTYLLEAGCSSLPQQRAAAPGRPAYGLRA